MEQQYILDAIDAALEAGSRIRAIYNDPVSDFGIELKSDNSPLTKADKEAHRVIVSVLRNTPYPVLSEEGKHLPYVDRQKWHDLWIVDPLDGTKEFIKRNGEFTVNIALVADGVPVMGVIYVPVTRQLYFAEQEMGAYKLNDITERGDKTLDALKAEAQRLSCKTPHAGYVVVASRSHLSEETKEYIEDLRRRHQHVELISNGSSIKICLVAEGKADIYPRFAPTMEWDTAAGHAIACAAGAEIYHAETGKPLCYNKENLLNPWFIVKPREI